MKILQLFGALIRPFKLQVLSIAPAVGAAAIGGAVSLVGGIMGNNSAKKEAAKARAYDEKVRKNSHQWEVADLEAAGLNKALSATHGSGGASTPVANVGNPAKDVVQSASVASAAALQKDLMKETTRKEEALANQAETVSFGLSKEREMLDMPLPEMKRIIEMGGHEKYPVTPRMVMLYQSLEKANEEIKNIRANSAGTVFSNERKAADARVYDFIESLGPTGKFLSPIYRKWSGN